MKASLLALAAVVGVVVLSVVAEGAKNAKLAPAERFGKVVLEEPFDGDKLDATWRANKGSWEPKDGILVGQELPADKHAAVLTLGQPNRNSAIKFSFKLDGAKTLALSLNKTRGHLFRVVVREDSVTILKDKDKRDPQSRVERLARSPATFKPGTWYTMLVEIDGDNVSVRTDNDIELSARDARLDVDKPNYRFVTSGQSVALDDVRVWTAQD